jgi:hypothetical protein
MDGVHQGRIGREQLREPLLEPEIGKVVYVAAEGRKKGGDLALLEMRCEAQWAAILRGRPIDIGAMGDQQL